MKKIKFYIFGILLLNFLACEIINPDEEIPAYLHVKDFQISTTSDEGSASAKITDAWIFANGEFIGAYDLPATIPILSTGATDLVIDPGIKENGIRATPNVYPFYERLTLSRDLTPATVDTLTPTTGYSSNATFAYIEDFELGTTALYDADNDSLTMVNFSFPDDFEGRAAMFEANEDYPVVEVATSERIKLPTSGQDVFLELNYKNDADLLIGLIGYEEGSDNPLKSIKITLTPKTSWNKIYINFTEDLILSDLFEYQVLFVGVLPSGSDKATFLLDNIKLVHF